jgi:5-methylcytosine-specific restriction endonuclease McrA
MPRTKSQNQPRQLETPHSLEHGAHGLPYDPHDAFEGVSPPSKGLNLNAPMVLVLNASFEPLHVCSIKRAITLLMHEIAERVEDGSQLLHSPSTSMSVPSVIRLRRYVKRPPRYHIAFNRRNVFRRDNHTWENIVTACRECNSKKRDRTPFEAKMKLSREPYAPKFVFSSAYGQAPKLDPIWEKYLG